ncbi:nucleotidyltransferase family protein [Ilyobacter polytropus]|uniref:DNA polymerase beta domain protein region n=1 Tax=Ilyobacter polytropus (strain ATCC 51220 / DSM 2926 / LMG 16218 / CuHBu1) TaxID=572544 RepID=E3HDV3_ILYPC|nr:nucleotidyltransferase domain-containing protein [Ilyobacter polytropus]ADO84565.1 DNA polymerase beta domain protein region [Ilyobacter polytropus DSM 2926]
MTLENFRNFLIKEKIFDKYALEKIGVFGSLARGEDGNDIDILVEYLNYKKWISIKNDLENNYHLHLDVVLEKYANPIVLMRAKKEIVYVTKYS